MMSGSDRDEAMVDLERQIKECREKGASTHGREPDCWLVLGYKNYGFAPNMPEAGYKSEAGLRAAWAENHAGLNLCAFWLDD